ncbi:MAG: ATP-binding cassette domain-containing protein [Muribaculaceae bacterium]|nr:ATP-binding cassette domain-containing protein [Muribaculaceae bacterium]MDE6522717.1 ATP-binding cassette domain-containing protein [Muribaculaceae bacterium]
MNILEVDHLTKCFGSLRALDDISFGIKEGSICGILGPNGAGKTTLLRIINGILTIDAGTVKILGEDASIEASRNIGYMPEERGLYDTMRMADQIMYFGQLKGGDPKRLRVVMNEYLEMFNLKGQERRRLKELSKGNQQKVQIICTLVHEPKLVILDEPFSGFDPLNGQILQQILQRLQEKGTTIILSSHNMPAIEEMCSDIVLVDHGHILVADSMTNVKEQHKDNTLLLTTSTELSESLLKATGAISEIERIDSLNWRRGFAYKLLRDQAHTNNDVLDAVAMQSQILHFEEALPSLKDIFISYTTHSSNQLTQDNNAL